MKRVRFHAYDQVAHIPKIGTKQVPANKKSRSYSTEELQLQILARKKIAWEHASGTFVRLGQQYDTLKGMAMQAKAVGDDEELRAYCEMMKTNMFEKMLCTSKMLCMRLS